jgi:hypothetical protein
MGLENILNNTHENFYWTGFILADGYITKSNRLKVRLALQDHTHLEKLGRFLDVSVNKYKDQTELIIQDKKIISEYKEKFEINNKKSYNPPSIDMFLKLEMEHLLSLIIGFIDGDGSITYQHGRSDTLLRIKNHSSWLDVLIMFSDVIMKASSITFPPPKINNQGYASLVCANLKILQFLKRHVSKHKLPVLERKWDKIDMSRISKYEIAKDRREKVIELLERGFSRKQISDEIGISSGRLSIIINKEI